MEDSREAALQAAEACADKKASQITVLDLRGISLIADYFVIANGNSTVQVRAVAEGVEEKLKAAGKELLRREGHRDSRWLLLDFGDVVVHIFIDELRRFYDLERLWGDAVAVDWQTGRESR